MVRKYKISTSNINIKIIEKLNQIKNLTKKLCKKTHPPFHVGKEGGVKLETIWIIYAW
jgi:hypothetical protein